MAIKRVLEERTYRDNAAKLCSAIGEAGGVYYAADVVEQVIHTRSPVLNERLRVSSANTSNGSTLLQTTNGQDPNL